MGRGVRVMLPYIHEVRDPRTGRIRRYFRRHGWPSVRLPGAPGSPEFQEAYSRVLVGRDIPAADARAAGTISAAIGEYYKDASFRILAASTQADRRGILERFRKRFGDKPLAGMRPEHVEKILNEVPPKSARNWLKALRALMQFARRDTDPTQGVKLPKTKPGAGYHTWSEDEIEIFERHHAVGTRARLAMALLLYTAVRRGDAIRLGPQHIRAGRLFYDQQKTLRQMAIPVHPELAEIIAASPSYQLTFLTTVYGKPFSAAGFSNWFRRMCNEAGLPHCSAHGLRKAQSRRLAEAGCTTHEIAAITGHTTLKEVQRYTDAADQVRMADAAMRRKR